MEKSGLNPKSFIKYCLYFCILSIPFGSQLVKISLDAFVIYPSLLFLGISFASLLYTIKLNKIPRLIKWSYFFFASWIAFSLIYYFYVPDKISAKFDFKNICLFGCYFFTLSGHYYMNPKIIKQIFSHSFSMLFTLLVISALIETTFGIHFHGEHVNKIVDLEYLNLIYQPVFLFDNPNNFTLSITFYGLLWLITSDKSSVLKTAIVLIICLFVSFICESRIAQFTLIIASLTSLSGTAYIHSKKLLNTVPIKVTFLFICLVGFHIVFIPKYFSPIFKTNKVSSKESTNVKKTNSFNKPIKITDVSKYNQDSLNQFYSSKCIRKALIYNGYEFIKKSPLIGIGPGQFRTKHRNSEIKYYTLTNIGPHNGLIELVSQYGIIIFLLFSALIIFFVIPILKMPISIQTINIFISILIYLSFTLLPSNFINIPSGWLLFTIIAIFPVNKYTTR